GIVDRKLCALGVASAAILEFPRVEATLADDEAMWDADEFRVGELDARTGIAIVVKNLDSRCGELGIQSVGNLAHPRGFMLVEGYEYHLVRGNRLRPDDALLIVILFNRRGN